MKITICGSMVFVDQMLEATRVLEGMGHEVKMPPTHVPNVTGELVDVRDFKKMREQAANSDTEMWRRKAGFIRDHNAKVAWADAILVLNHPKHGVDGYVGPNSLMEMGLAFYLGKPIFLLYPVTDGPYRDEVLGMQPVVLDGRLDSLSSQRYANSKSVTQHA